MEQRCGRQPRHERGILDRIPEPPATPAQFIISPIGASGDAQREEYPCTQNPRPHRAGKSRANLARYQRPDGEAERHRKPDITKVKRRWMKGEADVLKQRVKPVAFDRS